MIYLTHTRLMDESEQTVNERATRGEGIPRRVCSQLLSDRLRYMLWHARQDRRMATVAGERQRDSQILSLRAAAIQQVHATALVRYLREHQVTGTARDQTLREFYGVLDPRRAAVAEHRNYVVAASSQVCTSHLLELTGDRHGLRMIQSYETVYGQYFGMFCDRARALQNGRQYLLSAWIPEARSNAEDLKNRVLGGVSMPATPVRAPARVGARPAARAIPGAR